MGYKLKGIENIIEELCAQNKRFLIKQGKRPKRIEELRKQQEA